MCVNVSFLFFYSFVCLSVCLFVCLFASYRVCCMCLGEACDSVFVQFSISKVALSQTLLLLSLSQIDTVVVVLAAIIVVVGIDVEFSFEPKQQQKHVYTHA